MTEPITINIERAKLTWGDVEDLEEAKSLKALREWLEAHGGVTPDALRSLPANELRAIGAMVRASLNEALDIPNGSASS